MKKVLAVAGVLALLFCIAGCGKKSGLEGKVLDGTGKTLAGIKILAKMEQPVKGYEQFDAVTESDGTFTFKKMYPASKYILKPWSDKWTTETSFTIKTGPDGETVLLPEPIVIELAYSRNGSLVIDLATGVTRFSVSPTGVITDSQTGLEWAVGPDQDTTFDDAAAWVSGCGIAGGGWRMPTRQELRAIYLKGVGERNMDPVFKITGWWVWSGETQNSSTAWAFRYGRGPGGWAIRSISRDSRAYGVRSRR